MALVTDRQGFLPLEADVSLQGPLWPTEEKGPR